MYVRMALESSWIGGGEFDLRDMRDERGRRLVVLKYFFLKDPM